MDQLANVRVAATIVVHGDRGGLGLTPLVELLTTVGGVHSDLQAAYEDLEEAPVDPLLLNEPDFANTAALGDVVADLRAAGFLRERPRADLAAPSPAAGADLTVQQVECSSPVLVELAGDPTLLVALWLLSPVDGEYKVTEEYSIDGPDGRDVQKRVSFTTSAGVADLVAALREWTGE